MADIRNQCSMTFQYREPGGHRPEDIGSGVELVRNDGKFLPIPSEGDSVTLIVDGKAKSFKVDSRHFSYDIGGLCAVNVVVTDILEDELARRLKE